jgi:succinylglutamate desuccinylase
MLQVFQFDSGVSGNRVLFLGSVHGNEVCGSLAIMEYVKKLESGAVLLRSGSVTFLPFINQRACEAKTRFIDANLNRIIKKNHSPKLYEEALAQELLPFLEKATHVIDLHSMTASTPPLVFVDYEEEENLRLAQVTGVRFCIKGWADVFGDDKESNDTISYVHHHSGYGVTVECGQHEDVASLQVARDVIGNVLSKYTEIKEQSSHTTRDYSQEIIRIYSVIFKEGDGDCLAKDFANFDQAREGELLATRGSGSSITAEKDCHIVLPNKNAKAGHEWFYLGVKE